MFSSQWAYWHYVAWLLSTLTFILVLTLVSAEHTRHFRLRSHQMSKTVVAILRYIHEPSSYRHLVSLLVPETEQAPSVPTQILITASLGHSRVLMFSKHQMIKSAWLKKKRISMETMIYGLWILHWITWPLYDCRDYHAQWKNTMKVKTWSKFSVWNINISLITYIRFWIQLVNTNTSNETQIPGKYYISACNIPTWQKIP